MNKTDIIQLLKEHTPYDKKEEIDIQKTTEFITTEPKCFNKQNITGHITASAFIINSERTHCLLMLHKKLNIWLHFGGHIENDSSLQEAAFREAFEESGLKQLELSKNGAIFDLDVHIIPKNHLLPHHSHYDIRFLFIAHNMKYRKNNESITLSWIPLIEVGSFTHDPTILRMVDKVKNINTVCRTDS